MHRKRRQNSTTTFIKTRNRKEVPQPDDKKDLQKLHSHHHHHMLVVKDLYALKIKNKTKMSTLPLLVNILLAREASQRSCPRKGNKGYPNWKGKKITIFADHTILYTENSKEHTK